MFEQARNFVFYFIIGGTITSLIVILEQSDLRLLSGFATLVPAITLTSYFFIGESRGGTAVSRHAWMVLVGTLIAWVPYMIVVALCADKIGPHKAILLGFLTFFVLAVGYLAVVQRFGLFR